MIVPLSAEPFPNRLRRKIMSLVPLVVVGVVVSVVLLVLISLLAPYLPPAYHHLLAQLQQGDWANSRASLVRIFESYGAAKSVVFVLLQVLQVLVAPIPGQIVGLLGSYVFGFWHGLTLSLVGLTLGSLAAIGIGRVLGEQVVRKLLPHAMLAKFDYLIEKGGLWNFFLIFLLPALPDDAVCLIAGLTRLPVWKLVLVCVLGRLPGTAVLTFVGASVGGNMLLANVLLAAAMSVACVVWLWSEEIEVLARRWSSAR
jgi:uncharacterized membrane protein YdjX (TVP38/TMEM64 family)